MIAWLIPERSVLFRFEALTLTLSAGLFAFLWLAFYHGIRVNAQERLQLDWPKGSVSDFDFGVGPDLIEVCTQHGAEHGVLGLVLGFLVGVLLTVALCFGISLVLWLGLNALLAAALILFVPAFVLFRRSLRIVIARGRRCRGNLLKSCGSALWTTVLYTLWLQVIFLGAKLIHDGWERWP